MHRDQRRVRDALLPFLMGRVFDETPDAERDCSVLNRLLLSGPDPLFLMETCPTEFRQLCVELGVSVEEGRVAIEQAHVRGPGILLEGTGLPLDSNAWPMDMPLAWRLEAVWLVLAHMTDVESDYESETVTLRVQRAMQAGQRFTQMFICAPAIAVASDALHTFVRDAALTLRDGIPHSTHDSGFYVAFKLGHKVAAVTTGDKVFYGTVPSTTLDEQGVLVSLKISNQFGFNYCYKL